MTNMTDETQVLVHRMAARHEFEATIRIALRRGGTEVAFRGWVRDLSESGLRAFVAQDMALGELVTVRIALGPADKETLMARVARKLGTEYGLQFTSLSVEQRLRIREALRQQTAVALYTVRGTRND